MFRILFLGPLLSWAQEHPVTAVLIVAAVVTWAILNGSPTPPNRKSKDPARLFSSAQRAEGFDRCGGRCEGELLIGVRCRSKANQGDHWLPHSRGGATSMENFVGLCAPCNRSKSARIPSRFATWRLSNRRKRYWADDLSRTPGGWYAEMPQSRQPVR